MKAKPDEEPKPTPALSFSKSKAKPSGKEISQEATQLVCDLFAYADDHRALFDSKQQRAVASLLEKYPAGDIKELWQEIWDLKDEDRKQFAITDFLKSAEGRLESKAIWRESVNELKSEKYQETVGAE